MKAHRNPSCAVALAAAVLFAPVASGCSHNNNVPQTLAEQRRDLQGPGQIPPGILAQMRAKYGQGGSETQKIQSATAAAGAAKQAQNGQGQPAKPATAPSM